MFRAILPSMVVFNLFGDKKAPHSTAMAENAKAQQPDAISKEGWLLRLKRGLGKTSILLNTDLIELLSHKAIDEAFYGALETLLISANVGIRATEIILQDLRRSVREKQITDPKNL